MLRFEHYKKALEIAEGITPQVEFGDKPVEELLNNYRAEQAGMTPEEYAECQNIKPLWIAFVFTFEAVVLLIIFNTICAYIRRVPVVGKWLKNKIAKKIHRIIVRLLTGKTCEQYKEFVKENPLIDILSTLGLL